MDIELRTPAVAGLDDMVEELRAWQRRGAPMQLHPGDLGWAWQRGPRALAAALRTWHRDDRVVAIGLLDSPGVVRLTVAPDVWHDTQVAQQVVTDLSEPGRALLPAGGLAVEVPNGARVQSLLDETGWTVDEAWTPLERDLAEPVEDPGVRVEVVGEDRASDWATVHRSAFARSTFSDERWRAMTAGSPYADARSLLAYDAAGVAVADVTVWSAGAGRPGLLEPMGVHADHRGHGYGRAICRAAAAVLRELGASSAVVCTPSANVAGVATYASAGYARLPQRYDRARPQPGG